MSSPTFRTMIHATLAGFTWSESLGRFVRLLLRSDQEGYDVDLVLPSAINQHGRRLVTQYNYVRLTEPVLERLVPLSSALAEICRSKPTVPTIKLVLDINGEVLSALQHERRMVGL